VKRKREQKHYEPDDELPGSILPKYEYSRVRLGARLVKLKANTHRMRVKNR